MNKTTQVNEKLLVNKIDGKYGLINANGKVKVPYIYSKLDPFNKGLFRAVKDQRVGIIDREGKAVIDFKYNNFYLSYANCYFGEENAKTTVLNNQFNIILEPDYYEFKGFEYSNKDDKSFAFKQGKKWGLYCDGEIVNKPQFDEIGYNNKEFFNVKNSDKIGLIDRRGNSILEPTYKKIESFVKGLAVVKDKNDKFGIINKKGEEVVKPQYYSIGEQGLDGNFVTCKIVNKKRLYGLVNEDGKEIVAPKYEDIEDCDKNLLRPVLHNNKYGMLNKLGKLVVPIIYSNISEFDETKKGYTFTREKFFNPIKPKSQRIENKLDLTIK